MKLSIAIADTHALPSAFVVFRGFDKYIPRAAELGYDGVELALKRADEINPSQLRDLLMANGLEVSCISTGQVYADGGLSLTHEDLNIRRNVSAIFRGFVDLAEDFGGIVNIGRVRGPVGNRPHEAVEEIFCETARELCDYALPKGVTLILEPINRYEIDFINTVEEGATLMKKINRSNMLLMPDLFHMNIEDRSMGVTLAQYAEWIKYVHFADSNRLAPGQGHTDFEEVLSELYNVGYDGWASVEILPKPDPETAAEQAAQFLVPRIREYNRKLYRRSLSNV